MGVLSDCACVQVPNVEKKKWKQKKVKIKKNEKQNKNSYQKNNETPLYKFYWPKRKKVKSYAHKENKPLRFAIPRDERNYFLTGTNHK